MMRLTLCISSALIIVTACSRRLPEREDRSYLKIVSEGLASSVSKEVYTSLDFSRARKTPADSSGQVFFRVPFQGKRLSNGFVLLRTTVEGHLLEGRNIHLEKSDAQATATNNGAITIRALDGTLLCESSLVNGYIMALHEHPSAQKTISEQPEYGTLQEVVVVASYDMQSTVSYSYWLNLQSLWGWGGGSSGCYYYLDGSGVYSGGGTRSGSGDGSDLAGDDGILSDPPLYVDYESDINKTAIDVESYLKCFDLIPDNGSSCSIEILTDIPVDSDSFKLFDLSSQSPGHTFIQLKKANGDQSTIQSIGFYPSTDWKSILTTAPIQGKFVDNGDHEFNASLKMNVSPENFRSILTEVRYLARFIQYDIDEYNCTDFALDVFNWIRSNKLEIPRYNIPGGMASGGTRTPQGLYNRLLEMKNNGTPEAVNITIGNYKNWVAFSNGACN